uniref:Uncharacterized protein n=1 Tax=Plectus sambesii TaxID=2011161 RepID=A0A914X4X9_9BILA
MEALMDIISTSEHHESPAPVQLTYAESGTQWSSYDDSDSVSSKESEHSKDSEHSKLGNFFRKAKERGKRLVHRRKKKTKIIMVDQTFQTDTSLFETLEETASAPHLNFPMSNDTETETEIGTPPPTTPPPTTPLQSTTTFSQSPADLQSEVVHEGAQEPTHPVKPPLKRRISFKKFRLVFGLFLLFLTFLLPFWVASFLWGVFISMSTFVYLFIAQATAPPRNEPSPEMIESIAKEIARQKVLKQAIRYRGWMNELRRRYNPLDYSVNMTQSVVVELEGRTLRIARPKKNVIKHTFFNDPTLKVPEPPMIKSRAYDLMNADIKLRPHGLARRRWWNRKYPILIQLAPQKEDIAVDGNGDDSDSDYSQSDNEYLNDIPISEESDLRRRWTISKSTQDDSFVKSRDDSFVKSREVSFAKATEERHSRRGSTKSGARRKKIILFPRSSREKERWFHRLREASSLHQTATGTAFDVNERKASNLSLPTIFDQSTISGAAGVNISIEYYLYVSYGMEFSKTMAEIMKSSSVEHLPESGIIHMNLDQCIWTPKNADFKSEVVLAANALVARFAGTSPKLQ